MLIFLTVMLFKKYTLSFHNIKIKTENVYDISIINGNVDGSCAELILENETTTNLLTVTAKKEDAKNEMKKMAR